MQGHLEAPAPTMAISTAEGRAPPGETATATETVSGSGEQQQLAGHKRPRPRGGGGDGGGDGDEQNYGNKPVERGKARDMVLHDRQAELIHSASAYLCHMASDLDRNKAELEDAINTEIDSLKKALHHVLDEKKANLLTSIAKNRDASLQKLKQLNLADFTTEQKLYCPWKRIDAMMQNAIQEISVVSGTSILDLPVSLVAKIMEHLGPYHLLPFRKMCKLFRDAITRACITQCSLKTIILHEKSDHGDHFSIQGISADGDTLAIPMAGFQLIAGVSGDGNKLLVHLRLKWRRLYASGKNIILTLTPSPEMEQEEQSAFLSVSDLFAMKEGKPHTFEFTYPPKMLPEHSNLELDIFDCPD
ncbi:hypothetical protein Pelo_9832 [Pelomyxa schiedti]|nr:hypothetical protein Pelo_9832 [Pelomyxa schiedti]